MRKIAICLLMLVGCLSGCVQTQVSKSVQVTKDANGRITSTVITETAIQPGRSGKAIGFEYLKGLGIGD